MSSSQIISSVSLLKLSFWSIFMQVLYDIICPLRYPFIESLITENIPGVWLHARFSRMSFEMNMTNSLSENSNTLKRHWQ